MTWMPDSVRRVIGMTLRVAQCGAKHGDSMPSKGEGPGVFELVSETLPPRDYVPEYDK